MDKEGEAPATDFDGAVYLGVKQHDVPPDMDIVQAKRELYDTLFTQRGAKERR